MVWTLRPHGVDTALKRKTIKDKSTDLAGSNEQEQERRYRAPALEKGLDILELLAREGDPLNTPQIASRLGRSVSELFRMVLTLEDRGYIVQARGREGYGLTNKLFSMGLAQTPMRSLVELAAQEMKTLAEEIGQSCHMTVVSNKQIVVVARIESPRDLGFSVRLGYRRPVVESTSGVILYAFMSEHEKPAGLADLASSSDPNVMQHFLEKVKVAEKNAFIKSPSDFVEGVIDLSAPIMGNKGVIAALTIPYVRCFPEKCDVEQALLRLRDTCKRLSELLQAEGR